MCDSAFFDLYVLASLGQKIGRISQKGLVERVDDALITEASFKGRYGDGLIQVAYYF